MFEGQVIFMSRSLYHRTEGSVGALCTTEKSLAFCEVETPFLDLSAPGLIMLANTLYRKQCLEYRPFNERN
jgi:hypothetical protein